VDIVEIANTDSKNPFAFLLMEKNGSVCHFTQTCICGK
jgi:hypothetical protein